MFYNLLKKLSSFIHELFHKIDRNFHSSTQSNDFITIFIVKQNGLVEIREKYTVL